MQASGIKRTVKTEEEINAICEALAAMLRKRLREARKAAREGGKVRLNASIISKGDTP
jgi:hypothetical protein